MIWILLVVLIAYYGLYELVEYLERKTKLKLYWPLWGKVLLSPIAAWLLWNEYRAWQESDPGGGSTGMVFDKSKWRRSRKEDDEE